MQNRGMQGKHSGFPWQCAVPPGEGATDSHPGFVEHTHPLSHLAVDGDGAAAVLSVVSLFGSELRGGAALKDFFATCLSAAGASAGPPVSSCVIMILLRASSCAVVVS